MNYQETSNENFKSDISLTEWILIYGIHGHSYFSSQQFPPPPPHPKCTFLSIVWNFKLHWFCFRLLLIDQIIIIIGTLCARLTWHPAWPSTSNQTAAEASFSSVSDLLTDGLSVQHLHFKFHAATNSFNEHQPCFKIHPCLLLRYICATVGFAINFRLNDVGADN